MPNRIPTPGVKSPAVRKSAGATKPAKPAPIQVTRDKKGNITMYKKGTAVAGTANTKGFQDGRGTE